jgi:peptide-methionine (R)-S-oxide reductase
MNLALSTFSCVQNPAPNRKIVKTDAEWGQQLSPEEYHVTRQAGTKHPFSSQMCGLFEPGIYACLCCDTVLFDASENFESGTGWPSFTQPVAIDAIAYRFDGPSFLKRVETICNTCDAHLGHVFPDARGLARNVSEYKKLLADCDLPRRNDLDGRGTLSEEALAEFTRFFLTVCIDQVNFMESLIQPDRLRTRILMWAEEEIRLAWIFAANLH